MARHASNPLEAELVEIITTGVHAHERSLQQAIGASEIGTPCARRLGFQLAGIEKVNVESEAPWRPTVGTAVHTWLQFEAIERYNEARRKEAAKWKGEIGERCHEWCEPSETIALGNPRHLDRFLTELKIPVGTIGGEAINGTIDVYDRLTKSVIDWKVVGNATLKSARGGHVNEGYRVQGNVYGRGLVAQGFEVEWVVIFFLPSAGELGDRVFYCEPFDAKVGNAAFARARKITRDLEEFGATAVLPLLERANAYCHKCPWFSPTVGEAHLDEACPGAEDMLAGKLDDFSDILPPDHPDRAATASRNRRR